MPEIVTDLKNMRKQCVIEPGENWILLKKSAKCENTLFITNVYELHPQTALTEDISAPPSRISQIQGNPFI
jgi:hypothetical protein